MFGALTGFLSQNEAVHIDGLGTFGQIARGDSEAPMRLNLELEPIKPSVEMVPVTDVVAMHINIAKCVQAFGVGDFNRRMVDMTAGVENAILEMSKAIQRRTPRQGKSVCVYYGATYERFRRDQMYCSQRCGRSDRRAQQRLSAADRAAQATRFAEQIAIS